MCNYIAADWFSPSLYHFISAHPYLFCVSCRLYCSNKEDKDWDWTGDWTGFGLGWLETLLVVTLDEILGLHG